METVLLSDYDGETVRSKDGEVLYEVGDYLGRGAASIVYECVHARTRQAFALKVLEFGHVRLLRPSVLARYVVVREELCAIADADADLEPQQPASAAARHPPRVNSGGASTASDGGVGSGVGSASGGGTSTSSSGGGGSSCVDGSELREDAIRWVMHTNTKQIAATIVDARTGGLRELTLRQCTALFGTDLDRLERLNARASTTTRLPRGGDVLVPRVPHKYMQYLRLRQLACREIRNMQKIRGHENVLQLHEVLEHVTDAHGRLFLVLELAAGGELFDRIRVDEGCDERVALRYFRQLLSGVSYCHARGLAHRDLKPENLLLAELEDDAVLKIADFGLSALCAPDAAAAQQHQQHQHQQQQQMAHAAYAGQQQGLEFQQMHQHMLQDPPMRRLTSVVGSPHYVAPEVLQHEDDGYDGAKADAWSLGVILYALLNGSLPFSKDLLRCPRFTHFRAWKARALADTCAASPAPRRPHAPGSFTGRSGIGCGGDGMPVTAPGTAAAAVAAANAANAGGGSGCGDAHAACALDDHALLLGAASPSARSLSSRAPVREMPAAFFPQHLSRGVVDLLAGLLEPDPDARMTVAEALQHPWVRRISHHGDERRAADAQSGAHPARSEAGDAMPLPGDEDVDSFFDDMDDVFHEDEEDEDEDEVDAVAAQRHALMAQELHAMAQTTQTPQPQPTQPTQQQQPAVAAAFRVRPATAFASPSLQRPQTPVGTKLEALCRSPAGALDRRLNRSLSPGASRRSLFDGGDDDDDDDEVATLESPEAPARAPSPQPPRRPAGPSAPLLARFCTSLPAREVLALVAAVVAAQRSDPAADGDARGDRAVTDAARSELRVLRNGSNGNNGNTSSSGNGGSSDSSVARAQTVLTVRANLLRAGVYVVEFERGEPLDAPAFHRYCARIRSALARTVKADAALAMLDSDGGYGAIV